MDASDFLGSIRPLTDDTGSKFRWRDGVVVKAMRSGLHLLIDEISLAPDSVLERLNSVLEPTRSILLTDVGCDFESIMADSEFRIVATMNPGTDHGKKEA
jgi:midasin